MKRKIIIALIVIVIILAIATPSYLFYKTKVDTNTLNSIMLSFSQQYGAKQVIRVSHPSKLYMVYWVENSYLHVSLLADGVWVEIANAPITSDNSGE